jgi:hypothetical protein
MADVLRLAFLLVSGAAVALGMALQHPVGARWLGLERQWDEADRQFAVPDEKSRFLDQRICEKEHVATDLADGRLTLFEAAAIFLRLDEQPPRTVVHPCYQGLSREEAACRQVIEWAHQVLEKRSLTTARRIVAGFEEELRQRKEQGKRLF